MVVFLDIWWSISRMSRNMWLGGSVKAFFGFSKREMIGVRVLWIGMVVLFVLPPIAKKWVPDEPALDSELRNEIHAFIAQLQSVDKIAPDLPNQPFSISESFDPNTLDHAGWLGLGFTDRQAQMILNYVRKGGRFRRKEDLLRIYAVTEADYARVEDYIVIRDVAPLTAHRVARNPTDAPADGTARTYRLPDRGRSSIPVVEINGADSLMLQALPGIGPAFASRIIRFRDRLGGFHHLSQLLDVYGMDSARYEGFVHYVRLDSAQIRRISINQAGYDELRMHPLISNKLAGLIVRFREHHGVFGSEGDLRKLKVLDEESLRHLLPYLEF